jgi:carboxyl-terminal processing protease
MMKKQLILLLIGLSLFSTLFAQDSLKVSLKSFSAEDQHPMVYQLIGQILSSYHYKKLTVNDELSSKILDNYLENLDPGKIYFLQEDINRFNAWRNQFDDDLLQGNVFKAFDIYNVYQQRMYDRIQFTFDLLNNDMDFSIMDSFLVDRENAQWISSYKEYDELWRKKTKNEALQLKADGKDFKVWSDILRKRYYNLLKQMAKTKNEDVFSFFANSLTEISDPHTNYFSPRAAEDFATSMSLSLEGIGATLQTENEYTKVREVVKGGPADRSKQIKANDKIVAVGQGKDGEMVNVLDWRIDDVVSLIRGKKGTLVRLEILPVDAIGNKTKIIEIVRDKIVLEDQAAKSSLKEVTQDNRKVKVGVIVLPTFYLDLAAMQRGDANYKSTTRDVKKHIIDLKNKGAEAIVVDLRNNGGGSLLEAIELTGLFIKKGPVVQVKDNFGAIEINEDKDESITWSGPLTVLVNRFSASASEIFAAAIQDYNRGLVVGEKTFGKGTVQNIFDLNQFIKIDNKKVGQVKFTMAKFYRISGGSTQFRGVIPDIEFPGLYSSKEFGEEASEFALPYDEIRKADYTLQGNANNKLNEIKELHKKRMANSEYYKFLLEDIQNTQEARNTKYAALNEEVYKKQLAVNEQKKKNRESAKAALKDKNIEEGNLILDEAIYLMLANQ